MSSESHEKKMIVLRSSDGEMFEVEEAAALQSQTIKHMIEEDCAFSAIPLPNVTSKVLSKVIEYCNRLAATADEAFHADFVKDLDLDTLFDIILAANYLSIKTLLDLTCQTVADLIKDKSVEEVREIFNIKSHFTEEEEKEARKENEWAFS